MYAEKYRELKAIIEDNRGKLGVAFHRMASVTGKLEENEVTATLYGRVGLFDGKKITLPCERK